MLAGDALSLINPFTGEGIFYALRSGALAGAAAAGSPGEAAGRYAAHAGPRLGTHLRHSSVAAWLARHRWVVDAAVRAARRDDRVYRHRGGAGAGRRAARCPHAGHDRASVSPDRDRPTAALIFRAGRYPAR